MNLLLLLSALLSALTGAGSAVRRPEQAMAVRAAAAQPARIAVSRVAQRPLAALPMLVVSAAMDRVAAPLLAASADLWANRRRE